MKKALITGIAGQDGSYLAELLLSKGYAVYGIDQQSVIDGGEKYLKNINPIINKIDLSVDSLQSIFSVSKIIKTVAPDECYHLAASTFVGYAFKEEFAVLNNNINSTHFLLSSVKEHAPLCRFFFAASSELFGNAAHSPQNEHTPFNPRSIYGISKLTGYNLVKYYREQHGLFACSGILYNHESPRRGNNFVTKKVVSKAVKIKLGIEDELLLGNMDAKRDWGYAPDYVNAMHLMLQTEKPDDYVIASGEVHSINELTEIVFSHLGLDYKNYVKTDPALLRPAEELLLCGNSVKAMKNLNWRRTKSFKEIIIEMIDSEMKLYK
ncbi:MAG: GDP-mannose 4,6-dehydratase [Spirochaetota bacterium]